MIPKTIADVTPAWLGEALGRTVATLDVTQIGQGVGIMGDIYRVSPSYEDRSQAEPTSVVAQLQGGLATSMVTGGGMDLSNERGAELIATMAARHATAALDHDGLARLADITGQG